MVPPPTHFTESHTRGKRHHQDLHTNLAASHHPPLPQRKECDGSPGRLFANLRREHYLLAHLLLPGPPPRAHPGHSRSGHTDGNFSPPHPSIFRRTSERPAAGDEDPSPPVHGAGSHVKGGSNGATGTEGSRAHVDSRAASFDVKIFRIAGDYLGEGSPVCIMMASQPRHIDRF